MEVSTSVSIGGGVSWLTSSFSPFFFPSSSSSSSSSSSNGRLSDGNSRGEGAGDTRVDAQWQWAQVAELVPLPSGVIATARYFSLDLDSSSDSPHSSSSSGGGQILHGSNTRRVGGSGGVCNAEGGQIGSRQRHRARFVESLVFCGAVALIIFTAANSG